jgi:predicted dehydrogenase
MIENLIKNKIGLIGFGYWGKIIYNNLKQLDLEIIIVESDDTKLEGLSITEKKEVLKDYKDLKDISKVFIVTPLITHFELCAYFLNKKIDVFCEKPLTLKSNESKKLFELSEKNNCKLFVDWIFLFNDSVRFIKNIIKNQSMGELRSITMRRLNRGPYRNDIGARYDLMSHDLSILFFLIDKDIIVSEFIDYYKNPNSLQPDSCIGILKFDNQISATIDCSWEHPIKDRQCVFDFKDGELIWDDSIQKITLNNETIDFSKNESPLQKSLKNFLLNDNFDYYYHKKITLEVAKLLEK